DHLRAGSGCGPRPVGRCGGPRSDKPSLSLSGAASRPSPVNPCLADEAVVMSRIPSHTINDAPDAARPLLENLLQFSPTGKPLNLHAQMAHAPAVLEAYVGIRRATSSPGRLDQRTRVALMLASAVAAGSQYALAILTMLAARAGWGKIG